MARSRRGSQNRSAHRARARNAGRPDCRRRGGTFDFAFIDADKSNYANYYDRALVLLRPGGVAAIDNVLWDGLVIDPNAHDKDTESIRAFNRKLHDDARVAIGMATMGDGLTLACKL